MTVADVLMPASVQKTNQDFPNAQEGSNLYDNSLFALLLNCLCGAEEHTIEQSGQKQFSVQQDDLFPSYQGQDVYAMIVQNLIPAGMEANSGSSGDLDSFPLLSSILEEKPNLTTLFAYLENLSERIKALAGEKLGPGQAIYQERVALFPNNKVENNSIQQGDNPPAFESQGIEGSTANSFDPAELDNYKLIEQYWRQLSGKIEPAKTFNDIFIDRTVYAAVLKKLASQTNGQAVEKTMYTPIQTAESGELGHISTNGQLSSSWLSGKAAENGENPSSSIQSTSDFKAKYTISNNTEREDGDIQFSKQSEPNWTKQPDSSQAKELGGGINTILAPGQGLYYGQGMALEARNATALDSARIWAQVVESLKKQNIKSAEVKELTLQLQPEELGELKIYFKMENGKLHLTMTAAEQTTSIILQQSIPELRNGLIQAGILCGNLEMGYKESDQQPTQDRENRQYNYGSESGEEERENNSLTPLRVSYLSSNLSGGRIDLSA